MEGLVERIEVKVGGDMKAAADNRVETVRRRERRCMAELRVCVRERRDEYDEGERGEGSKQEG